MLCVTCFRDAPNETRMHCVDIDAAYTQTSKKLDRAVIVSICHVVKSIQGDLINETIGKLFLGPLRSAKLCSRGFIII